jgi:topoisomerase-4 subunit B
MAQASYSEDNIRSLDWKEHIRMRPGMYIGKLGDGSSPDDGIYILLKEVLDNSIDEFVMGAGSKIDIGFDDTGIWVRDYGRGIPLGKVIDCVSKINTGGKYDSKAFKKSVGLNGVGTKAVNALSQSFIVSSYRDGKQKQAEFSKGELKEEAKIKKTSEQNGTYIHFIPDATIFKNYSFRHDIIEQMIWNYAYLNSGLSLHLNGKEYLSKRGLLDLLENRTANQEIRYPIIYLSGDDIELSITHGEQYGEEHYSFVNGQHTTMGGSHQQALREAVVKTIREFFRKDYEAADIRSGLIAAISVKVQDPVFESQTKTKLGSQSTGPGGPSIRSWISDFVKKNLDNYLHKEPEVAIALNKKILQSERERKDMAGIKKLANERAKKASVYNKKLRDCRVHYGTKKPQADLSTIFITEGDSASGSLTKARDVKTQAVFSLRGKPLNSFGLTKKVVYENEEFNLLQHALNIEDGLENLRYNRIIIATDADVDGMHIRLLLMTFFLQFFPELVREGHVFILQTPLFRVRDKKQTVYCYDELEKRAAMKALSSKHEITRFKGLGEISPDEFGQFIGEQMRLEPVKLSQKTALAELLRYYMGKNTQQRQQFIIENLRGEQPLIDVNGGDGV